MVNTGRRARNRVARHSQLVAAASSIVSEKGLDGLTMQEVADRVDCAVGTIYTYFSSKSSLLGALQIDAIRMLSESYEQAASQWDLALAESDKADRVLALTRLIGVGRLFSAWPRIQPREFRFLQILSTTPDQVMAPSDAAVVLPAGMALFAEVRVLHDTSVEIGAISQDADRAQDDGTARTVRWIAALHGAILVAAAVEFVELDINEAAFDQRHMCDSTTTDALFAWGADPLEIDEAVALADRMEADGTLLPATVTKGA